ncbi:transcription factor S-II, central domain-domain-containing protein [Clohesyomyces aquaticus]|uniref:Transcription elongation factor n=1 Tax=Clohesyomyces aquaticus TaxID=1231657 RepID=A0A1Y2AA54_9PLEO|nr:transcription factor S-II, central domain-domain-containing protein [Clohesyomyces aquaticus]
MDVKEVELRGKSISKAMAENEPSSSFLKLLGDLKTGVKADEDLLRKTKIGVTVNRLRTHKDPQVAKLAGELVNKWRDEVKLRKVGAGGARTANGTASPAPASGTQSPAPAKAPARKHNVDPEKRNHKTDKVDYRVTGNETRDNCVRLLYDGLALMTDELPSDVLAVAKSVEAAAFANTNNATNDTYKTKIRSLFQNLKNKSNPGLRKRVLSGEIAPKRFVVMTHDELKSEERRELDKAIEKENMNNALVAQIERSISTEFQCSKCRKKMVSYSQAQTRSADEPMTTFCECMNCGNRWKFS